MVSLRVLLVVLLCVRATEQVLSCKSAEKLFKHCCKKGYEATTIKGCATGKSDDLIRLDKRCNEAEDQLYSKCGYRHCPGWMSGAANTTVAVTSDHDACTQIGISALEAGGSAVDAAIAVLLCLGAVHPQSSGIGGGGFMLVHTKDEDKAINFRNTAPQAARKEMFVENSYLSLRGGKAVSIPGEIAGYFKAHAQFGYLNWKDLFAPSIAMLRSGMNVTRHLEKSLKVVKYDLIKNEFAKMIFYKNEYDPESYLREGDMFTNERLAAAYENIAERGPTSFYKKDIAKNIVKASQASGGILTLGDFRKYKALAEEPMRAHYRSKDVITTPSPSSGPAVSLILQLLDNFDLSTNNTQAYNKIIEAFRFGYAMRARTGDKDFSKQTKWVIKKINDGSWAKSIMSEHLKENEDGFIQPYDDISDYMEGGPVYKQRDGTHTTHVSIIGRYGDAVSVMSSVNNFFGSCIMSQDGIILNNEMNDFSIPGTINFYGFEPAPENYIAPGKRAQSSASPTIVLSSDGDVEFVSGAAGGSRIITSTLLSVIRAYDWGMSLSDNANSARVHDQLNMETRYESSLDPQLLNGLQSLGYKMVPFPDGYVSSAVNSVSHIGGVYAAEGDPRKGGTGRVEEV